MEIVLRVKRSRNDSPIDIIALNKKPKTFESAFASLSLSPPLFFKRVPAHTSIQEINESKLVNDLKSNTLKQHSMHMKESRAKLIEKWRNKVLEKEDTVYCDGEPMVSYGLAKGPLDNCIIDEYVLCENLSSKIGGIIDWIYSDSDSEEDDHESEDSNREDHPWNDYPDEDSEDDYSKSEEYEDYEVSDN